MTKTKGKQDPTDETPVDEIGIGDQVKHAQWGVGTVLFRSGSGDSSKAVVVFPEEGQKKLMLKYAKLKKVGSAPKSEVAKIKAIEAEKHAAVEEEDVVPSILGGDDEAVPLPEGEDVDVFEDDDEEHFPDRGGNEEM